MHLCIIIHDIERHVGVLGVSIVILDFGKCSDSSVILLFVFLNVIIGHTNLL